MRGLLHANLLIADENKHDPNSTYKRTKYLADVLEEGDPLTIVAGNREIQAVVKSSGRHLTAQMVDGKLVRGR